MNKETLKKLFAVLKEFNISYILIGGYAVAVWGSVRATKDIDFLANIPSNIILQVIERLKSHGFVVTYKSGSFRDPVLGVIKLKFKIGENKEALELLLGIRKMPPNIYLRFEKIHVMGIEIPVVSPEDLIVLKLLAGGPVDIHDARNIYNVMREKLDMQYLKKELKRCKFSLDLIKS